MMDASKTLDTNVFFSGGAGMFLQYHDVIKPVWLYAIMNMIVKHEDYGLPLNIIEKFSVRSILEWYMNRRYQNPLRQLDWAHRINPNDLNTLMQIILKDESIYRLAPLLNIERMIEVYHKQHMSFPIYIYSENEEPYIKTDCMNSFHGIQVKYLYGDLKNAIQKCDQNFTYIFSNIDLVKNAAEILKGTCSHILLARDFRYNYRDNFKTFKHDLENIMTSNPFVRIGTTLTMDLNLMNNAFDNIIKYSKGVR